MGRSCPLQGQLRMALCTVRSSASMFSFRCVACPRHSDNASATHRRPTPRGRGKGQFLTPQIRVLTSPRANARHWKACVFAPTARGTFLARPGLESTMLYKSTLSIATLPCQEGNIMPTTRPMLCLPSFFLALNSCRCRTSQGRQSRALTTDPCSGRRQEMYVYIARASAGGPGALLRNRHVVRESRS